MRSRRKGKRKKSSFFAFLEATEQLSVVQVEMLGLGGVAFTSAECDPERVSDNFSKNYISAGWEFWVCFFFFFLFLLFFFFQVISTSESVFPVPEMSI